tara:strand:- start:136 stop:306 length:171 start_codon:yes stop_codon:yes gene_type:complete
MPRFKITFIDEVTRIFHVEAATLEEAEDMDTANAIGDIHEVWDGISQTVKEEKTTN